MHKRAETNSKLKFKTSDGKFGNKSTRHNQKGKYLVASIKQICNKVSHKIKSLSRSQCPKWWRSPILKLLPREHTPESLP